MQKKEDHGHLLVRNLNRVSQCSMQRQKQPLTLNLPTLDIIANILWTSPINLAANAESSTENLLNTTLEFLRKGFEAHGPSDLDNLVQSD